MVKDATIVIAYLLDGNINKCCFRKFLGISVGKKYFVLKILVLIHYTNYIC